MNARKCPLCKSTKSVVRQTSFDKTGNLVRYRACGNCGATWKTVELEYEEYMRVAATIKTITDAVKMGGVFDE